MTEKECAIIYATPEQKTVSPVIDAEAEQIAECQTAIEILTRQIRDVYEHQMRLAEVATAPYRERLAERCRMLAELTGEPACMGKFWDQPEPRTQCDSCQFSARCS